MTPADSADLVGNFHYPMRHSKLERSLGRFIITWGTLERELDLAFPILFRIDPTLGLLLPANVGTKAKLDLLSSTITMLEEVLPPKLVVRARSIIRQLRNLSGSARNTLAHAQPWIYGYPDNRGGHEWQFTRLAAREELDVAIYPTNAKYWESQAAVTLKHAQRWHHLLASMQLALAKITDEQFNYACAFRGREVGLISPGPRTRPVPRTRGSRGRSATRKQRLPQP